MARLFVSTCVVLVALLACAQAAKVGDKVCFSAGLNMRSSACGSVVGTSTGSESGAVLARQGQKCSFGTYTWLQVDLGSRKVWVAEETGLATVCSGGGTGKVIANVPYVNQRWDTPDDFGGSWACGPTCAVMAMAHYGKIKPKPIRCSQPSPHTNDFGWYLPNVYTSLTGVTFNRMQKDSSGRPAYGAWGTCTDGGGAWAWRIQEYVRGHGMIADFYDTATFTIVRNAIEAGNLVVLSTQLTSSGHLILVRGYTSNGSIVVNDPWGNANLAGYPANGERVTYTWGFAKTKWCVVIRPARNLAELENPPLPAPQDLVEYTAVFPQDIEALTQLSQQ